MAITTDNKIITENFLKTYTDKTYKHTTMIRHNGVVVAFAMDEARRIYYSVLNLNDDKQDSPLDVNYWLANPQELGFPNEISQVGYSIVGATMMPIVKKGSRQEAESGTLRAEEIDLFLSSTARLTADAPFQALTDEKYVYIFRQSIAETDGDMVFKTESGGASGDSKRDDYVLDIDGKKVPIVNDTLLLDRFILAGTLLKPKMEVRYQRSRHKTKPQGNKDSLAAKDMNGKPFFEPTQELDFVRHLQQGRFSALLLPTQIADVQRWQVFAHNSQTGLIDSFNVERAADGLFNTKGTQFYTSPEPEYQKSVFERQPGKCPFTEQDLIPIVSKSDYAESALQFDGVNGYIQLPSMTIDFSEGFTVEAWVYYESFNYWSRIIDFGRGVRADNIVLANSETSNKLRFLVYQGDNRSIISKDVLKTGKWIHLTAAVDSSGGKLFKDGELVHSESIHLPEKIERDHNYIGKSNWSSNGYFHGKIDELRIWNRPRTADEIKTDMNHRLIGNEPGLMGYWRFDEGSGDTVYDQTENANHGKIHGGVTWVNSDAPVGDHPGVRRTSFKFDGRTIESGLSALLYYQQEKSNLGYNQQQQPIKKSARVMLAVTTVGTEEEKYVGVLDFALSSKGKLAQVPDNINLGTPLTQGSNQDLERLSQLEQEILDLENGLNQNLFYFSETAKFQASDKREYDFFGNSVAISGDCAIVGAYLEDTGGSDAGAAYIFEKVSGQWQQKAKLQASDKQKHDSFGISVAISGDRAIVGANREDTGGSSAGAAYIFEKVSGQWQQKAKLQASDKQEDDYFGISVAISGDSAIVGANREDTGGKNAGAAYIFEKVSGQWQQKAKLQASDKQEYDYFGISAAISGDCAIVGSLEEDTGRKNAGAAYIFEKVSGQWQQKAKLQASDKQEYDYFGNSVAISGDCAIVGANMEDTGGRTAGAAYIFEKVSGQWQQKAKLQASDKQEYDYFGNSVAISGDSAIVGSIEEDTGGYAAGAAYIFEKVSGQWQQKAKLQASDKREYDYFGNSVAISGDCAIVGAYLEKTGGYAAGAAYMFSNVTPAKQQELADKQSESERIKQQPTNVTLPMHLLHTDPCGLTVVGGLLGFASTNDTPQLFDSVLGQLALYFRGTNDEFFAAYYNTNITRAQYSLAAETGSINFLASSAEPGMEKSIIKVEATDGNLCTVTIENTTVNIKETWKKVPRDVSKFVSVLNGTANKQIFIGILKANLSGNTTSLNLESKVKQTLENGDTLLIGEKKVIVSATVTVGATVIPITSTSLAVDAQTSIYLLPYDYEIQAKATPDTYNLQKGSLLLRVSSGNAKDKVQNGTATRDSISQSCAWVADSPGKAYAFDGQDDYIAKKNSSKLAQLDATDDLTLEAWVNSKSFYSTARLIHHNSANSQYGLALKPGQTTDTYTVVAGVGNQFIESEKDLPCKSWQHLAAVFNQSYGLQFNGGYLKCGTETSLNISQDLTVEIFLEIGNINQKQGLISKGHLKDGTDQDVPYSLYIDSDSKLVFAFEDKNHKYYEFKSERSLSRNSFQKIALTRKRGQKTIENKATDNITYKVPDEDGQEQSKSISVDVVESVDFEEWDDIKFYIETTESGNYRFEGDAGSSEQELEIGRLSVSGNQSYFSGTISEIRVWNTALDQDKLYSKIKGQESGLIAWWHLEENEGNIAYDAKGSNHGNIVGGVQWVKNPEPNGSQLRLYLNGQPVKTTTLSSVPWGDQEFTLASYKNGGSFQDLFSGTLEEIRIWQVSRTQEQIQDNLFTRLKGEKQDLIANYTFDLEDETELKDYSLLGNHLQVGTGDNKPTQILSTAPISNDIAQVRSALAGVSTQFHDTIDSRPAVQEYGDTQYDSEGNLTGVMKRCYTYIKNGQWHLFTGYKVGNLITEWIGQAQFNPQIIGYLEGTPPVPSENMTYGTQGTGTVTYEGNGSVVTFTQADEVMYNYSTSKENGFNSSFGISGSMGVDLDLRMLLAPLGFGISQKIEAKVGISTAANFEASGAWSQEQGMSSGRNVTKELSASLGGNWEDPTNMHNPTLGRRWMCSNSGFALVQSETADIFALRLGHNNALVSFKFQPNPDIPKDWNIIPFPLNPRYTMQGTLDGKIGYNSDGSVCTDPNYPQAATYGEYSFFKPKEAYALKKRIDQEIQELQNYYDNFDASPLSANNPINKLMNSNSSLLAAGARTIPGAAQGLAAASTFGSLADALTKDQSIARKFAKRNLANTYVWTTDGGFYAETTDTIDVMQDSVSGSYSFNNEFSAGLSVEFSAMGADFAFGLDSSMGASLNITKTKSKEASKSFSIDMSIAPSGDMQYYDPHTGNPQYEDGQPTSVTGRVDAYRFMTFYLDSSKENFEDLFSKVVDPIWLEQSSHPNAIAMRQANQAEKKPGCWRLMHRVTYVSRILPEFTDPTAAPLESAMKAENIESNYELIKKLEPFVKNKTGNYVEFSDAVRNTLTTYLPELLPHAIDVIKYAALYFGVSEEI